MIKSIFTFFTMFLILFLGIASWVATKKENKILIRNIFIYAVGCAVIATAILTTIVMVF